MNVPGAARSLSLLFAAGLCSATAGLVWFGYRGTEEWRRSTELLLERRIEGTLALLSTALNRDMKGAQASVLLPITAHDLSADPPHDLRDTFARAFARFPYPESFFVWRPGGAGPGSIWIFNRSERPPAWLRAAPREGAYPVVMLRDPELSQELVRAARHQPFTGGRFAVFEWAAGGTPYQVVVHRVPGAVSTEPAGLVGLTVNLAWLREGYFPELLREVAHIGASEGSISLAILDETGQTVTETGLMDASGPLRERRFPLLFFDPAMTSLLPRPSAPPVQWTARAGAANDTTMATAARGARRTFGLLALAAAASVIGMLLTARAVRARAELTTMKSEFISTVTHELKSPLALIRLVGDTLALGRYTSADTIRDYARLLSQEAQRLTRLIDNLLTYARVTEGGRAQSFDGLDLPDLVDQALERFRPRLMEMGFDVGVEIQPELPHIRGDRTALLQALDNLIDNAIKYSGARRSLMIRGTAQGHAVCLEVADRGRGISAVDVPRVFERFYRGGGTPSGGSGLGLAIVRRVVNDLGGRVALTSEPGEGTSVRMEFPVSRR